MKDNLKLIGLLLFVGCVIAAGIAFEIYRWHTFQEVTDSQVSYWKWKFIIDNNGSRN